MHYPEFFNQAPTITLQDELSNFLGTFEDGIIDFNYLDIVKSAGHSCPTVAGAYLTTYYGLKALYNDELPQRGAIQVEFKEDIQEGVAGVIGSVISNITGATTNTGFKGIGNKFNRNDLMFYSSDNNSNVRFTRLDTDTSVDVVYDPSSIPADSMMQPLMQKTMQGLANPEDKKQFGKLWQQRVEQIFLNSNTIIEVI
ncbi:MAG: hypothetical protein U9N30_04510 [Campylobacterota bacterium]|nr:hypothetical protein [Campylobacterota bacterium]